MVGYQGADSREAVEKRRRIADALMAASLQSPAQSIGEGIGQLGKAFFGYSAAMANDRQMREGNERGQARATADIARYLAMRDGQPAPATPRPAETPIETTALPGGFDPAAIGQRIGAPPPPAQVNAVATGGDLPPQQREAFQMLTEMGYPPHVAAGLVGNLVQESGPNLNTGAIGDGGNSFGAVQWNGPRREAFMAWAQQNGRDPRDLRAQMEYLNVEMQGPEARAREAIMATRTPEEAAQVASERFWRPGNPMIENRTSAAARVAAALGGAPVEVAAVGRPTFSATVQPGSMQPQPAMNRIAMLMEAAGNDWMSEGQRGVVNALLQREFRDDPNALTEFQRQTLALQRQRLEQEGRNAGRGEFGLSPVWGTDANGNPALIQLGRDGTPVQPQLPEGFQIARDPIRIDAGTETILLDPQTRQPIGRISKDVAGEAAQREIGQAQGQRIADAPRAVVQADQILADVDAIINDENLGRAVGWGSYIPFDIPGFNAETRSRLNKLEGQAFLQAFESLKGGGAITNTEGTTATQAIARLNRAQTADEFRDALREFRAVVALARERAARRLPAPSEQPATQPAAPPEAPRVLRYNPATGELE